MPRRARPSHRIIPPDRKFGSVAVQQFISKVMQHGKRTTAEAIVYGALEKAEGTVRRPAIEVFDTGLRNATPLIEVKPRRVGGATYQVPLEVAPNRSEGMALRWIVGYARARKGVPMHMALANELKDASSNQGNAIRKRDDVHKAAQANRAFAHFRW